MYCEKSPIWTLDIPCWLLDIQFLAAARPFSDNVELVGDTACGARFYGRLLVVDDKLNLVG